MKIEFLTRDNLKSSVNPKVFTKGNGYYMGGRVKYFEYNHQDSIIRAIVNGSEEYFIVIDLSSGIINSHCTCAAFREYSGFCKHIVAVLLKYIAISGYNEGNYSEGFAKDKNKFNDISPAESIVSSIKDYFGLDNLGNKKPLQIQFNIEVHKKYYNPTFEYKIWVKVGVEKLYVVRDMKNFIDNVINEKELSFTTSFDYDRESYYFPGHQLKLIEYMSSILELERFLNNRVANNQGKLFFVDKFLYLNEHMMVDLFELMEEESLVVEYDGAVVNVDSIVNQRICPEIDIVSYEEKVEVDYSFMEDLNIITDSCSYVFWKNRLHRVPEEQRLNLMAFKNIYENRNNKVFGNLFDVLNKIGNVHYKNFDEDEFKEYSLESKLTISREGNTIVGDLAFNYGKHNINALETKARTDFVFRKTSEEQALLMKLDYFGFRVNKNKFVLESWEDQIDFLHKGIKEIETLCKVYALEKFSSPKMVRNSDISVNLNTQKKGNFLTYEFNMEGLEEGEITDVINSIKNGQKYYKMKNQRVVPLNNKILRNYFETIQDLDLNMKDVENGHVSIPKYRALYLDEKTNEVDDFHIRKNIDFKELIIKIKEPEDFDIQVPEHLVDVLRSYQVRGFKWINILSNLEFGGILADDMGLGKTIQMLTYIKTVKANNPEAKALIVAPSSLLYNWENEVDKFVPGLNAKVVYGSKVERKNILDDLSNIDVLITSYTLIRNDLEYYKEITFENIIIDEAQHIKNPESQTSKSVKLLNGNKKFALTGTPIENSVMELWSIFDFIMPGYLFSKASFASRYFRPITRDNSVGALESLKMHTKPFILRRLKGDVLKELPDKIENNISFELNDDQKKVYISYLKHLKGELAEEFSDKGFNNSKIKILAGLMRLRQICCEPKLFLEDYEGGSAKLDLLEEIVEENLESNHRIILFSQFTSMLGIIKKSLEKKGIEYFYLDGSTKLKDRNEYVNRFNEGEREIFLISLKAGGTGLNLTGADTVIHFDPWWNPAVENQATDRAHRIGQEKVVHVIRLIAKGTIEEKIQKLQDRKKQIFDSVIKPGESFITSMSENEIMELFNYD